MFRRLASLFLAWTLGLLAVGGLMTLSGARRVARAAPASPHTDIIVTTTIQAAIDFAQPGDTVLVPEGVYTESLNLDKAVSLQGTLSNTTIVVALSNERAITVTGATITNSVVISGLTFRDGNVTGDGGGVWLAGGAQPLLQNLIIQNNSASGSGGGLYAEAGATLMGVQLISNTAPNGGGGWVTTGDVSLSETRIELNLSDNVGGLRVDNGNVWLTETLVLSNTTVTQGNGGVWVSGSATLSGGLFENNVGLETGGGLYAGGALTVSGTQFISNTANDGGGAYAGTTADVTNALFQNNQAGAVGGGLLSGASAWLTDTQFFSNTATLGGGLRAGDDTLFVGGLFQSNVASVDGGGAYLSLFGNVSGAQFVSNTASGAGGGLYATGAITLTSTSFISNTAQTAGGAWIDTGDAHLSDVRLELNQADNVGGLVVSSGNLFVTDTLVLSNTALTQNSGGLWANGSATIVGGRFENNVGISNGGGFYAGAAATLTGTQFISNTVNGSGGGGYVIGATPTWLTNTTFISNTALIGGGLRLGGGAVVSGGLFQANSVSSDGGGLNVTGTLTIMAGTRFIGNRASLGGAVSQSGGSVVVINALFARNKATGNGNALNLSSGGGSISIRHVTVVSPTLASGSAIVVSSAPLVTNTITDTIIINQGAGIQRFTGIVVEDYNLFFGNFFNTTGFTPGMHSLTADPAFVDMAADDYHLTPASAALDLGANAGVSDDFEGDPRPQGGGYDIGWDEAPYTATPDLVVSKTVTPSFAITDTLITYTIAFSNTGAVGYNVVITDLVPGELISVTALNSGALLTPTVGLTYTWQAGTLLPGASGLITITGIVSAPIGIFTNTIEITSTNGDLNPTDNIVAVPFIVTRPTTPPTLSDTGDQTTYTGVPLVFTVVLSDSETPLIDLTLAGSSSNQASVPDANIVIGVGSSDGERTITITAVMTGTATITLTVTDSDYATATDTFILTVEVEQPKLYLPLIMR